ncbi:unnamed protein product [Nippostrongylus brasiliensis]|uniref:RNA-directed DNA polymerase n=1 Tax=Nippostrongylus brasiliensis TaxID=27835 RepID=A0A0N4YCU1_NIPBR|nr:unnamed protein product [Nippostrongylus brasiliensis]
MYVEAVVNNHRVEFLLDTGSDITLLNDKIWRQMGAPKLERTNVVVKNASGSEMKIHGKLRCEFEMKGHRTEGYAYVTPYNSLMGLEWIQANEEMMYHMKMMVAQVGVNKGSDVEKELMETFPAVFEEGLGHCTKEKAELILVQGVRPVFRACRPVAHAAMESVDKELDRLLEMGVIMPVTHSEWAAPIVCVRKANGKLRVCADFSTGLNRALQSFDYPLPVPEDIFASLNGGTVFSQIDLSDAYLQIELTEEAKKKVVINTHRGLFQYNRLPFGIKTAPGIFQQIMNKMVSGLRGVATYLDDILVCGRTEQEHKENLIALFRRIEEYGFKLRLEKCIFSKPEIRYLGFIKDRHGRRPNPEKIEAIKGMVEPKNVSQLRAFLGMKDNRWDWSSQHQKAFDGLKAALSSELNLAHYDPRQKIVVAADACDYGIGGVISHRYPDGSEKPIAHASRSLTSAEKNYSQIEKEALALVFTVKKFHKYVFGRRFLLLTDHRPLLAIFGDKKGVPIYSANRLMRWATTLLGYDFDIEYVNTTKFDGSEKPIAHASRSLTSAEKNYSQIEKEALALVFTVKKFHKYVFGRRFLLLTDHRPLLAIFGDKKGVPIYSANRLMRWATTLLGYDFDIEYVNTTKFGHADGLSRLMQKHRSEEEEMVIAAVESDVSSTLRECIRKLPVTHEDVEVCTKRDPVLKKVKACVNTGRWIKGDSKLIAYYNRRETLSVVGNCIMTGERVVIPQELRTKVLKELHVAHPGIVRMKKLARSYVYWPSIDKDCEDVIKRCTRCQESAKSPVKVPLETWPAPTRVWDRIHVDLAGPMHDRYYMVVVDALSKWPEMDEMRTISAGETVKVLKSLFARYGLPQTIVSDNGTQFVSEQFKKMCEEGGISHIRTATYHPQSNGQAERFVEF